MVIIDLLILIEPLATQVLNKMQVSTVPSHLKLKTVEVGKELGFEINSNHSILREMMGENGESATPK